jgi:ABC-type transporter MlaC component
MKASPWTPLIMLIAMPYVYAQQVEQAPDVLVKRTIEDVMSAAKSGSAGSAGDPEKMFRVVEQKFLPQTDFMRTTRLAVGSAWSQATPAQQKTLFEQFQSLLARTYATQLTQLHDQSVQFKYQPMPPLAPGATDAVVKTIVLNNDETMNIDYRLNKTSAGWKIYDINMMGAWMIQVYRRQFADQIAKGGIDGLIKFLVAHNQQ